MPRLGEVLWIVDLNRQSLDRVVPDIAAGRIGAMFAAAGWQTINVKYGRRLRNLFDRPDGDALRQRLDEMSNEEYQRMLRAPAAEVRERLIHDGAMATNLKRLLADLDDREVALAVRDLGGHDLADLVERVQPSRRRDRPPIGRVCVHDQGVEPANAGSSGEPFGAVDPRSVATTGYRVGRRRR